MDHPQLPVDRNCGQDMQEQGKGQASTRFNKIHPLGRTTLSGQGNTTGRHAKIRIIHGNKKWLTTRHFGRIVYVIVGGVADLNKEN